MKFYHCCHKHTRRMLTFSNVRHMPLLFHTTIFSQPILSKVHLVRHSSFSWWAFFIVYSMIIREYICLAPHFDILLGNILTLNLTLKKSPTGCVCGDDCRDRQGLGLCFNGIQGFFYQQFVGLMLMISSRKKITAWHFKQSALPSVFSDA